MAKLKSERQERLVQEYLIDLNQTQAAIRAGYSPKSASQQASELFAKPNIRARVEELMAERSRRTGINQDRILQELARIAFLQPGQVVNIEDATLLEDAAEDDMAAIASVKVKQMHGDVEGVEREIRFADKLKALELLMRHQGMLNDKMKLSGALPVIISGEDQLED